MTDQQRLQAITIVIQEILDRLFLWDITKEGESLAGLDANAWKLFLKCKEFERVAGSATPGVSGVTPAKVEGRVEAQERKDNVVPFRFKK